MVSPPYIEFRARSAFSFLEGGSPPEDLAGAAASLDIPAVALLDRDGLPTEALPGAAATREEIAEFNEARPV